MGFYCFEEFCEVVRQEIGGYLTGIEELKTHVHTVFKNNGVRLHGMQILGKDRDCSPSIYLEEYYSRYCKGEALTDLLSQMAQFYRLHEADLDLKPEDGMEFSKVRDKIIFRLVNRQSNRELLQNCPYREWNDLAVTFRWLACDSAAGVATALVTHQDRQRWQVDCDTLMELALRNTPRYLKPACCAIEEMLKDLLQPEEWEEFQGDWKNSERLEQLYVLTNTRQINGASVILYPGMLQNLEQRFPDGVYLLPGSVHEWIVVPCRSELQPERLRSLVAEVNAQAVTREDWLSHNIYQYRPGLSSVELV